MKKTFLKVMLTLVLVISFGAVAVQAYDKSSTTHGWPWTAISKTITKDYASEAEVLAEVHYSEYIDGKWYGGTLQKIGDVVQLSHAWRATYTGEINY